MSTANITRQFEAPGYGPPGPPGLAAVRRDALARFGELGLPTRRIETWHYTDLSLLAKKDFRFNAPPPEDREIAAAAALLEKHEWTEGRALCVFIDGYWVESLSRAPGDSGLDIATRELCLGRKSTAGDRKVGERGDETALAALNTAFAAEGAVLRFSGDATSPVDLVFVGTGRQLAPQFRLRIELAAGAQARIVQHFLDLPDAGEAWLNLITDIEQDEDSRLVMYRLQSHGNGQYQTTLNRVRLAGGAHFTAGNVELGGALVRNEFEIALAGERARTDVFGIALTRNEQHCDTRVEVDHRSPHTTSRQNYRAIVADKSRSVFNGKVIVREQAQHIDARQRNDNLLLSPKAEADSKPELEIYADQVVCSHGATVGELDEDQLFYLQARGIDLESARGVLTRAFAETILEDIEPDDVRARARAYVHALLPGQAALEDR